MEDKISPVGVVIGHYIPQSMDPYYVKPHRQWLFISTIEFFLPFQTEILDCSRKLKDVSEP